MNIPRLLIAVITVMSTTAALAQDADLQPRVQTSGRTEPAAAATTTTATAATTAARTQGTPDATARKPDAASPRHADAVKPNAAKDARTVATKDPVGPKGNDSLQLSTTQISGNRELPKLLYVVPWRRAELGDFAGRPPNSLVDEALAPVDREVFQRQNRYYAALQAGTPSAKSQPGVADGPAAGAHSKDER